MGMRKSYERGGISRFTTIILNFFFILVSILFVIPFLYVVAISVTPESLVYTEGYRLFPTELTTLSYELIFRNPGILLNAYKISIVVTLFGAAFGLLISTMLAYQLTRKDFKYRNAVSFFVFFTMLFNGGLVPWYLVVTKILHIQDTLLAMVLPYSVVPIFVLFLKGYLSSIPMELYESAKIDGCNEFKTFFLIAIPLSKPGLATVGLLFTLMYWNDWFLSLMFIDRNDLVPLQAMLYRLMNNVDFLTRNAGKMTGIKIDINKLPSESLRMAVMVVAAGPMLFIFPFFQKFFIKGLTVGSVKG